MAQKLVIVAVKDQLSNVYSQPMFFATEAAAIRAFHDALQDPNNTLSKHPKDFDMHKLGLFDDATGHFESEIPVVIAFGAQLVKPNQGA